MASYPIAVSVSDIHLCQTPPPARSKELDWFEAQLRPIIKLKELRDSLDHKLPIICAGDIFDKWNPPLELVNFALKYLPPMYAVPGQHDLPHHNLSEIKKTAYWTLVEAGRVYHLGYDVPVGAGECMLWGFPWGTKLKKLSKPHSMSVDVAVLHHFVFTPRTGYPGAPEAYRARLLQRELEGFKVAVFGDNHKGFQVAPSEGCPSILNNGGFMRRRSDEADYIPCAGVIYSDGSVERVPLEAHEEFQVVPQREKSRDNKSDFRELLGELGGLSEVSSDFKQELQRELTRREPTERVKDIVWMAVEKDSNKE